MGRRVLWVDCCVRGEESRTRRVSEGFIGRYGGDEVTRLYLYEEKLEPLTLDVMEERERLVAEGKLRDGLLRYARLMAEADEVVVSAPYWDLSFPAVLKLFLEQASVTGVTFTYTEHGLKGLCRAKRAVYITTAGGSTGRNLGYEYVKALFEMYGIPDTSCILAEGLDIENADVEQILAEVMDSMNSQD